MIQQYKAHRPFVLVHGMYQGGWCWQFVGELLRRAGAPVLAPTLTGLGDRAHLLTREVSFATHVRDIIALLEYEDIEDVVLVGHSYGGEVAHAVLHTVPERIGHVVYLDSAHFDKTSFGPDVDPGPPIPARPIGPDGVRCYPVPTGPTLFGVREPDEIAWMAPKLTPHPALTREEPRSYDAIDDSALRRTYVACLTSLDGVTPIDEPREIWTRVKAHPAYDYREMTAPHNVMITHPVELAELLAELRDRK